MIIIRNKCYKENDYYVIELKHKNGEIKKAKVSEESYLELKDMNHDWHIHAARKGVEYVSTTEYLGIVDGKPKYRTIYLHRLVMNAEKGKVVDHINHDTLDSRLGNLRYKSFYENLLHRKGANINSTTGVRNVAYDKRQNKYIVQLQVNGKNKIFGKFTDLDEAAKVAEEMREKYYKNKKERI
ncbi:HNH endonuclease [Priestia megaterium]|uniref:HNH endonuclease n=1 Tax=Priestia megaterium TaxID=1404 RepID=UPI00112E076B|nr:HNH endonuclease [Priestia megaterium]TPF18057.1 hypothetical protein CBE78_02180 [Priestia megaterium]TPF22164.1 hypothetical protein CBE79_04685 [Priestia megaterium]